MAKRREPATRSIGRRSAAGESHERLAGWFPVISELLLRPLGPQDEAVARSAHEALREAGYDFFLDYDSMESWADMIGRLDRQRRGSEVAPGRVPAAFLVAWVGQEIVGRISIRFELNEYLASAGGHVGYAVLPAHRRLGYGTEILRQGLVVTRSAGVSDVLLTCAVDNIGSQAVIEKCGGEFESVVHDPRESVEKRRYWIREEALRGPGETTTMPSQG